MSFWNLLASGVSGIFGGISSAISSSTQRKIAREYNQAQRELAEYQNEWNLEMWNKQNAYNSPVQQMARYQAAGLNPHLIYGQGSNGNSQAVPKAASYDIAKVPRLDAGSAFNNALNSAMQMANIELVNANKVKVQEDTELSKTQRLKLEADILWQNINNYIAEHTKNFKIFREKYDTDNAKWTSQGAQWDMRSKRFNFTTLLPTQYRSMVAGINKINQEIATSKSQEDLNIANKDYLNDKNAREEATALKTAEVMDAQIRQLDAQSRKAYADALEKELQNKKTLILNDLQERFGLEIGEIEFSKTCQEFLNAVKQGKVLDFVNPEKLKKLEQTDKQLSIQQQHVNNMLILGVLNAMGN